MACAPSRISFLDVEIFINKDGTISSSLFRKLSSGNTILHAASLHPKSLFKSIPYSQYLCLKRNCSKEEDFLREANNLYERIHRGYSHTCLKKAFNRGKQEWNSAIFSTKSKDTSQSVRVIMQYSKQHQQGDFLVNIGPFYLLALLSANMLRNPLRLHLDKGGTA